MGSFPGHAIPGTLFLVIGVWHMWCSLIRYASNPKAFQVRVWNPVPGFDGRLKYLELYVIAIGAFFDLCIEFLYSTHLKIVVHGVLNPSHMNDFEHSGMLLMFFIFGVVALLSEKTRYLPLPEGALCLVASAAFTAEYLLFYFHSTTHKGLEGWYHFILVLLIGLCILSTIAGALMPTSFPADLCSGMAMTLQGLWFYQTAFTLYGSMMPDGCLLKDNEVKCHSPEHEIRGELLANFQLFIQAFSVLVAVAGAYIYIEPKYGRSNSIGSHALDDAEDQSIISSDR
ncbi:transmembrane protein 45B-like [Salvia hispanica]|uniref:transmembrane protein 45B-like n=1 Tax=Salvia hispanica TaxID=49212 RepID=UPI0020097A56|nr:transmembrane protein 45B-like [Salvia hispanica]XP_047974900.1 transmembrane protein 45B-like [Salvia hispanica]